METDSKKVVSELVVFKITNKLQCLLFIEAFLTTVLTIHFEFKQLRIKLYHFSPISEIFLDVSKDLFKILSNIYNGEVFAKMVNYI